MVCRNRSFAQHKSDYLFYEIAQKKEHLQKQEPRAKLINLGIGDTTEPLCLPVTAGLVKQAEALGTRGGYRGYPSSFGDKKLRDTIAQKLYQGNVCADDIFISDGAKCDVGRLQHLFGPDTTIAIQDPSYPVYEHTSYLSGKAGRVDRLQMDPENNFFPKLTAADVIYICSPNNPTGVAYNREQLKQLVDFCKKNGSILIFDAAYFSYIRGDDFPRSIYEIEGAQEVAIEINSFSKVAGFTGIRVGWSVVPQTLCFDDGSSVQADWKKIVTTFFNGVSHLSQAAAMAALSDEGLQCAKEQCDYYLNNCRLLRDFFLERKFRVFGGVHAPYLWIDLDGKKSWEIFDYLLQKAHIITTPGVGFGAAGEGYLRISGFCSRLDVTSAIQRMSATSL